MTPRKMTRRRRHPMPPIGRRLDVEEGSQAPGRPRKRIISLIALLIVVVIAAPYGWRLWQYYRDHESTDDAYVVGDIIPISPPGDWRDSLRQRR